MMSLSFYFINHRPQCQLSHKNVIKTLAYVPFIVILIDLSSDVKITFELSVGRLGADL